MKYKTVKVDGLSVFYRRVSGIRAEDVVDYGRDLLGLGFTGPGHYSRRRMTSICAENALMYSRDLP